MISLSIPLVQMKTQFSQFWSLDEKCKTVEELVEDSKKTHLLHIENMGLFSIPQEIFQDDEMPQELDVLILSRNKIMKIPMEIQKLHQLKLLNLSFNKIKSLKEVVTLTHLLSLDLRSNLVFLDDFKKRLQRYQRPCIV